MESRKATIGVYVPPGRRSDGNGKSSGSKPKQTTSQKESSPRQKMPNCCEDDVQNDEDDSLSVQVSKTNGFSKEVDCVQKTEKSPKEQKSAGRRGRAVDKKVLQSEEFPIIERKIQRKVQNLGERKVIERKEPEKRDGWRPRPTDAYRSESMSLEKFHANEVPYIDSHCHTDFIYEYFRRGKSTDHEGLCKWVEQCSDGFPRSFAGLIANFIQPPLFVKTRETQKEYDLEWIAEELNSTPLYLGTTWGCHPHHAQRWCYSDDFWNTLEGVLSEKKRFRVVAVGECGIDLHRCQTDLEVQKLVFERHVVLAFKYDLPLVIHCRNGAKGQSEDTCLEIISKIMAENHNYLHIHRHCFTEDWETAKKWLSRFPSVHFGFTGGIFQFRENQLEAIRRIPLDRILLETDGPYFKPKIFDGVGPHKACLPGMAIATAFRIAELKGITPEEVLRATYNNTKRLYKLAVF